MTKIKYIVGVDNGKGTVGVITPRRVYTFNTPLKKLPWYSGKNFFAIDTEKLEKMLPKPKNKASVRVFIERPMVNPSRFRNSLYAVYNHALLEQLFYKLGWQFQVISSVEWQKHFFPDIKGTKNLKQASKEKCAELGFDTLDCDGLLIAKYYSLALSK